MTPRSLVHVQTLNPDSLNHRQVTEDYSHAAKTFNQSLFKRSTGGQHRTKQESYITTHYKYNTSAPLGNGAVHKTKERELSFSLYHFLDIFSTSAAINKVVYVWMIRKLTTRDLKYFTSNHNTSPLFISTLKSLQPIDTFILHYLVGEPGTQNSNGFKVSHLKPFIKTAFSIFHSLHSQTIQSIDSEVV